MSQSTHNHKDARTQLKEERINLEIDEQIEYERKRKDAPIRLTIEQADEVLDALRWVDDDWENMDEAERITHKGMRDVFWSILDQYPIQDNAQSKDARKQRFRLRTYTHLLGDKDLQEIFEILDKACRRKDIEFPDEELVIGTIPEE